MANSQTPFSPQMRQTSSTEAAYRPPIDSMQQTVRKLCNLLTADSTDPLCAASEVASQGVGHRARSSANRLKGLFWEQLLRSNNSLSVIPPVEQRVKQAFLDFSIHAERAKYAERILELAGNLSHGTTSLEEGVWNFLLDLQASSTSQVSSLNHDCKASTPNVMSKIFERSRISRSRRPEVKRCTFDFFRPQEFEAIILPEPMDFFRQKSSIIPKKTIPLMQEEPPLKLYVGDCLTSVELGQFHAAHFGTFVAPLRLGNADRLVIATEFLEELGRVAIGMSSALFDWEEEAQEFRLKSDISLLGFTSEAKDSIASLICAVGSCVQRIRRFTAVKVDTYRHHPGLTFTHFLSSVKFYMEAWTTNLKDLWKNFQSLLDVGLGIRPLLLPVQLVDQFCMAVTGVVGIDSDVPTRGLRLLQLLYESCLGLLGMESLLPLGLYLLEETAKPFFAFATSLAVLGDVHDPFGEFGITVDQDLLTSGFKDEFWEAVLTLTDFRWSFLSNFLLGASRAAKGLFLLRLICPYHPLLPHLSQENRRIELTFNFNTDPRLYRQSFEEYGQEMRMKIEQESSQRMTFGSTPGPQNSTLKSHGFSVFRRASPESGDNGVFPVVWRRYNKCLKAIVQQELLSVIDIQVELADTAVVKLFKDHLGLEDVISVIRSYFFLENGEFAAVFVSSLFAKASVTTLKECLDFSTLLVIFDLSLLDQLSNRTKKLTLLSTHFSEVERSATSFDVSDYLGLQYKIDWPLSMIVTPDLVEKCNVIFRRLLRIRGCTWAMNDAFVMLSEGKGVANDANRCLLSVYRHEIAHFARILEVHLMDVAIHRPWRELQMRLAIVTCFEEIRHCVAAYFNSVYDLCIVAGSCSSKFFHRLNDIFRLVMRFYGQLRAEASFEDLQKTFSLFQHCVQCVWQYAEKRSVPLLFDAECFLARLDFSGYVQRTAILAVRHTNRSLLRSPYGTL